MNPILESFRTKDCLEVEISENKVRLQPNLFWPIALIIFVLELLLSGRSLEGFPGPVRYYAEQWTTSYASGFSRRGLLGECLRLLHMDNGDYRLIAFFSWLITFALFLLLVKYLNQALAPLEKTTRAILFISILLSPLLTGMLVATTGDPIQLVLLLYIGATAVFLKSGRNLLIAFLVFACLGAVSTLIHEASMFFIGPFILLAAFVLRRSKLDKVAFAGFSLGVIPVLLFTIHATELHSVASVATLHFGHSIMIPSDGIYHPESFGALLKQENESHFHSGITGYVATFRNLIGALSLPLLFVFILQKMLPARRWILAFGIPLLLSFPLWVIAHDWGRFSSYLFMLTIMSLTGTGYKQREDKLSFNATAALLLLSGVTASRSLLLYPQKGLGGDNYTMLAVLFICTIVGVCFVKGIPEVEYPIINLQRER